MGTHSAVYRTLMALHLISVIGGFGLVLAKGVESLWVLPGDLGPGRKRLWEAGIGLVYLVPVLGVATVFASGGKWQFSQVWIGASFLLWLVAAAVLSFGVRPGERRLADLGASSAGSDAAPTTIEGEVRALLRRSAALSGIVDVAMAISIVLMVAKPGV